MLNLMEETIRRYHMLQPGDTVVAALSGGADSTALLLGLLALQEKLCITLRAVHINHGLRGAESHRDAAFCEQLCAEYGVPFSLGICHVAEYAAQKKHTSCEMAARELRYAKLEELCPLGAKIATAHTASDNTETLLERLTRGTGLAGLCGIPPVRGRIIRPLLYVSREQVLGFLAEQGQPYVTDSSNEGDAFFRNRLRHHVLPVLRQQNPEIDRTVGTMTRFLSDEQQLLEQQAQEAFSGCFDETRQTLSGLQSLHPAMRRRVLALFLRRGGVEVSAARIARAGGMPPLRRFCPGRGAAGNRGQAKSDHRSLSDLSAGHADIGACSSTGAAGGGMYPEAGGKPTDARKDLHCPAGKDKASDQRL